MHPAYEVTFHNTPSSAVFTFNETLLSKKKPFRTSESRDYLILEITANVFNYQPMQCRM